MFDNFEDDLDERIYRRCARFINMSEYIFNTSKRSIFIYIFQNELKKPLIYIFIRHYISKTVEIYNGPKKFKKEN